MHPTAKLSEHCWIRSALLRIRYCTTFSPYSDLQPPQLHGPHHNSPNFQILNFHVWNSPGQHAITDNTVRSAFLLTAMLDIACYCSGKAFTCKRWNVIYRKWKFWLPYVRRKFLTLLVLRAQPWNVQCIWKYDRGLHHTMRHELQWFDVPVFLWVLFTARCTVVQSAVLRLHVVCLPACLSVRPSVCLWRWWIRTGPHRLEILETNYTNN